jgi:hypothetical protein
VSVVEDCQVELAQPCGVGEYVDFDDHSMRDSEAHHRERPSTWSHDDSRGSIHERDYEQIRIGMQTLFTELGISTTATAAA